VERISIYTYHFKHLKSSGMSAEWNLLQDLRKQDELHLYL